MELSVSKDGLKMNCLLDQPDRVSSTRVHWAGTGSLELESTGNLLVHYALGTLTDIASIAYQEIDGIRISVICAYGLYNNLEYGFELTGRTLSSNFPVTMGALLSTLLF